jgi:hypothetical protein
MSRSVRVPDWRCHTLDLPAMWGWLVEHWEFAVCTGLRIIGIDIAIVTVI